MIQYAEVHAYCGWREVRWLLAPYVVGLGGLSLAGTGLWVLAQLLGFRFHVVRVR